MVSGVLLSLAIRVQALRSARLASVVSVSSVPIQACGFTLVGSALVDTSIFCFEGTFSCSNEGLKGARTASFVWITLTKASCLTTRQGILFTFRTQHYP
jgi:hypothetical protein